LLYIVAERLHPWKETYTAIYWPFVATAKLNSFFVMNRQEKGKRETLSFEKKKFSEERVEHSLPSIRAKWRL
jgi:hypothetical protein